MILRAPKITDAAAIWRLLESIPELERNTCYAYVVLCADFADSCVVAVDEAQQIVGFVIGYVPPRRRDEVFVWQVGVGRSARGTGLGARMLDHVAKATSATYLTATVAPDNEASRRLFQAFARRRETTCAISAGYPADLFAGPHQPEELMRIGPLTPKE